LSSVRWTLTLSRYLDTLTAPGSPSVTVIGLTCGAVSCVDNDFEPRQQDSSDDEETIEKDEREHKNVRSFI